MQSEPLVSIIMPAYNAERYIEEAVHSVIQQTWQNWELIIVNDGSTDGTQVYLDTLVDSRIRVIKQKNKGVSAARNVALDIVQGKFITFLDADDTLTANSIMDRANYLVTHSNVDIVLGRRLVKDKNMSKLIRIDQPEYTGYLKYKILSFDGSAFLGPYLFFRHDLLGNVRFNEFMTHAEDWLFYITLAFKRNAYISSIDSNICSYRRGHLSAMADLEKLQNGYSSLIKELKKIEFTRLQVCAVKIRLAKIMFLSWLRISKRKSFKSFFQILRA